MSYNPMLPPGSDKCRCTACGEYFNSATAFDRHRLGEYGAGRRCRSAAESLAAGWARNRTGHWITKPMTARDRIKHAPCELRPAHASTHTNAAGTPTAPDGAGTGQGLRDTRREGVE